MIQQTTFLGMSLRLRRRRRALVLGYYGMLMLFVAIPLARHRFMPMMLMAQTLTIGGLFGGIKFGGPVKPYGDAMQRDPEKLDPISLNLSGRRTLPFVSSLLDERETTERDRAHYTAYRILRWSLLIVTVLFFGTLNWTYDAFKENSPTLLWLLLVFVLSLPQSVILWTEPNLEPNGELTLLSSLR